MTRYRILCALYFLLWVLLALAPFVWSLFAGGEALLDGLSGLWNEVTAASLG